MLNKGDIIGYVTLPEDEVFTQHYEYAGAETRIMVKAGRYPITYAHPRYNHCMFSAELPGVVVSDYFYNRIGAHGFANVDQHVGEARSYYLNWSPMDFTKPYRDVELLDSVVVDTLDSVYSEDCGRVAGMHLTRINVKESEGIDPATLHPEADPYPGSEYLRGFQD